MSESACWVSVRPDVDDAGRESGVWVLTLERPDKLNALTEELGKVFQQRVDELALNPALRAVVLTGAGRAFSSGGDLAFLQARAASAAQENAERMRAFYRRYLSVRDLPVPCVAAVHGAAIGAGLCLAMACDIRVVEDDAQLGFTFVRLGLHPGMGATHLAARALGPEVAARLLLTGDVIGGQEAQRLGLALESVPSGEALPRALALARRMANAAPLALRATLRSLRLASEAELERALWREADAQAHSYASEDLLEGIAALREKRPPRFRGR